MNDASPIYDKIGHNYDATRRADPFITERLVAHLAPAPGGLYLDIGCGTGNYLAAMLAKGLHFYGMDPADTMLEVAREKCGEHALIKGSAEHIPFGNEHFDGIMGIFTTHHWTDLQQGLSELHRVSKPGAHTVLLSFTPQQMYGYWLYHYFPKMIERSAALVPELPAMTTLLHDAGFTSVATEPYFVHEGLQDHFLLSNKYRPEQYLDPNVRNGISAFSANATPEELAHGLNMLRADIATGHIQDIIARYENDLGDYLFIVATR